MKSLFHPKRFAQVILALTALTFTQCNKPSADAPAGSTTIAPKTEAPSAGTASANSIALIGEGASPSFSAAREKGRQTDAMNNLRQVQTCLKIYAGDNDGKYPAALSDLIPKYTISSQIIEFRDYRTKQRPPWLYRSSLTETSPAEEVLVAAPVASPDGKRVVGFNDGSVKLIPEAEFQALWNRK